MMCHLNDLNEAYLLSTLTATYSIFSSRHNLSASPMAAENAAASPPPWYAVYPAPRNSPATILREEVLDMMKAGGVAAGKDYLLVDLRRNDHEVNISFR